MKLFALFIYDSLDYAVSVWSSFNQDYHLTACTYGSLTDGEITPDSYIHVYYLYLGLHLIFYVELHAVLQIFYHPNIRVCILAEDWSAIIGF